MLAWEREPVHTCLLSEAENNPAVDPSVVRSILCLPLPLYRYVLTVLEQPMYSGAGSLLGVKSAFRKTIRKLNGPRKLMPFLSNIVDTIQQLEKSSLATC